MLKNRLSLLICFRISVPDRFCLVISKISGVNLNRLCQIQKLIEQVIQRIDPLSEKSEKEESYIGNACKIKIQYFRQKKDKTTKDYQMVIKYIDMLMRYDLDTYNQLKATFEDWRKKAKR